MRSVVRIAIVFLLLVLADAGVPAPVRPAEKQPPSVLILNSYHQGYEWSDNEIEGVLEGLRSAYPEIRRRSNTWTSSASPRKTTRPA